MVWARIPGGMDPMDSNEYTEADRIGQRIRAVRNARGLSQAQLGEKVGLNANRIQQYENGARKPKSELLKKIADALGVSTLALTDPVVSNYVGAMHAFFEMEDQYDLRLIQDGAYLRLEFGNGIFQKGMNRFLSEWAEEQDRVNKKLELADSDSEKEEIEKAYRFWKWNYPRNLAEKSAESYRDMRKMKLLQEQVDELYAKMHAEAELTRIDTAIHSYQNSTEIAYTPIQRESELILFISKMIEEKIAIKHRLRSNTLQNDETYYPMFSIKTCEFSDEAKLPLIAELIWNLDQLSQNGIEITRRINSEEKELYITYYCQEDQLSYFYSLFNNWQEMETLPGYKDHFLEKEIRDKFLQKITDENDVEYIPQNKDGE